MSSEIGVCSWSFEPAEPEDLARACRDAGVRVVQLGLPAFLSGSWQADEAMTVLHHAGLRAVSGMISTLGEDYSTLASIRETGGVRVDATWPSNLALAERAAALAERLRLGLVTFHAGFLPPGRADSVRATMISRVREIADRFADHGVGLGLETGQETAETLLLLLEDLAHPGVSVNFDPANMILYGTGDPVASLDLLAPHVGQIHIKDAVSPSEPGTWGEEVAVGSGEVDWPALLAVVDEHRIPRNLIIEREAGDSAVEDVAQARAMMEPLLGPGRQAR